MTQVKSIFNNRTLTPLHLLAVLALTQIGCSLNFNVPLNAPKIKNGVIDLRTWDFDRDGPISLSGDWKSFLGEPPRNFSEIKGGPSEPYSIPGKLSDSEKVAPKREKNPGANLYFEAEFGRPLSGISLSIEGFPRSKVICESDQGGFISAGRIAPDLTLSKTVRASYVIDLPTGSHVRCNLSMIIDKDTLLADMTSVWRAPRLGNGASIRALSDNDFVSSSLFFGLLFTLALYFAIHWLFQRSDTQAAFASVMCALLGMWFLSSFSLWQARLDYTFAPLFVLVGIWGVNTFSKVMIDVFNRWVLALLALAAFSNLVLPREYLGIGLRITQILTLVAVPGIFRMIGRWWRRGAHNYHSRLLLVSFSIYLILSGGDVFADVLRNLPLGWVQFSLLFFMSVITYAIASHAVRSRKQAEEVIDSLTAVNEALAKFVPTEFLRILGREDVTQARLGESKNKVVTVLVADIRNFTTVSEKLSPEETLRLINRCFSRLSPKIKENQGFIDRYIGDSIMAIFPENADHAVRAAVSMQKEMELMNLETSDQVPLELGIGIHKGEVTLGTIGEEKHYEATVLAQVVNTATDLEALALRIKSKIIISEDVFKGLSNEMKNGSRWIGDFVIQGLASPLMSFEVFAADPDQLRDFKLSSRDRFEFALSKYQRDDPYSARSELDWIVEDCPEDQGTQWWVKRIAEEEKLREGALINRRAIQWEDK